MTSFSPYSLTSCVVKKSIYKIPFLNTPQTIAVAVSGGPDSMALCHALQSSFQDTHKIIPLIVNHGLRPEAEEEANLVAMWLKDRGFSPEILTWEGEKPLKALQEKARQKRHELLKNWCYQHNIINLCFGHHLDDQQETQMMRLLKGSYLNGMGGMQQVNYESFGRLIRPFLKITKDTLIDYCHSHNVPYVQDPSNESLRFLRTYLRHLKGKYPTFFYFPSISFNQVITDWIGRFFWNHGTFTENSIFISRDAFFLLPFTFQQEIISYLVMTWGTSKPYPPRRRSIQLILKRLILGQKSSLRGLEFSPKKSYVLIKT